PEWLMKDDRRKTKFAKGRVYLDPGLPAVREYLVSIVEEIVNNYDVDGIHLDSVRYPGEQSGYNEDSVLRFNEENSTYGNPKPDDKKWGDWRRAQVTELVRLVKNT
ncbi:MAG: family 10 glycosylhydrolase, partial [Anaerolineae bacterium]|nr:family 10 glycosylhydrolase [Anaerolineae bacterium]NIQ80807.1 family 10 glycosylhydrolase [Anaerolineae bacterium]